MSRFGWALLVAVALHAALLFRMSRRGPSEQPSTAPLSPAEIAIEWQPAEALAQAPSAVEPEASTPEPVRAPRAAELRERVANLAPSAASDEGSASAVASPDLDTESALPTVAPAEPRRRPIDLGLDGKMLLLDMARAERPGAPARPERSGIQRSLETALSTRDAARGLARGGVFVTALSAVAREAGPSSGRAVIQVTVGRNGETLGVNLVEGTPAEWSRVLKQLRQRMLMQRVRVPRDAAGLRVTLVVRSRYQRASGSGADDSALSLDGPSPGALGGAFDLSDLSGSIQRVVSARVLSEEVL